jgi:hypothetical protein
MDKAPGFGPVCGPGIRRSTGQAQVASWQWAALPARNEKFMRTVSEPGDHPIHRAERLVALV